MKKLFTLGLLVSLVLSGLAGNLVAQEEIPQFIITASAEALVAPETLPEGLVTVAFENSAETPFIGIFGRLNEGVTMEDLMKAMAENPMAMISQVTLKGGPGVMPGLSSAMTYNLEPGNYVLMNVGTQPPQMALIGVEDGEDAEIAEPVADVTVVLEDFVFGIPLTIPAGEQLWQIDNTGEQWHEIAIVPVEAGTTLEDVLALLKEGEQSGLQQLPLVMPLSSGERAWVTVDLQPGNYAIICNLPDILHMDDMKIHHQLGMVQLVSVEAVEADATAESGG